MFYIQMFDEKGHALIGSDSEFIIRDLKTLRGLKNRMRNWVQQDKSAAWAKVFAAGSVFQIDVENAHPIAVFPVVNGYVEV